MEMVSILIFVAFALFENMLKLIMVPWHLVIAIELGNDYSRVGNIRL
jgi:hypothetical protein